MRHCQLIKEKYWGKLSRKIFLIHDNVTPNKTPLPASSCLILIGKCSASCLCSTSGSFGLPYILKLHIHSQTLCSRTRVENLFFHELSANQGKMTNQLRQQLCENCWWDSKIFRKQGRGQKFRWTRYPLNREHPLYSSKKLTGNGSQQTVQEQCTNYTDIVFSNWFAHNMFASVYAA